MIKKKATTLVEILVYFALLGIFLTAALSFAFQIINISELSSRLYELQAQSSFVQETIKTTIQTAESVDTDGSTFDSDTGVLSLIMNEAGVSPTVFSLSNGEILMQEGNGQAIALHSSLIEVTSLRFHRITYDKTPDQIQVDAVLTTPSDLANTDASLSLHFTVSLRP
jgi:Tfp pilus assembly protein FimT